MQKWLHKKLQGTTLMPTFLWLSEYERSLEICNSENILGMDDGWIDGRLFGRKKTVMPQVFGDQGLPRVFMPVC